MTFPLFYCAYCSRSQTEVEALVTGPGINICDACVETIAQSPVKLGDCSFAGEKQVNVHIGGSTETAICDACLQIAREGVIEFRAEKK